jgi:hypothetical protein
METEILTAIITLIVSMAGFITYQTRKGKAADERESQRVSVLRAELAALRHEFDEYRVDAEKKRSALQFKVDGLIADNDMKDKRIEQLETVVITAQAKQTAQADEKATLIEIIREVLKMLPEAWAHQTAPPRTIQ